MADAPIQKITFTRNPSNDIAGNPSTIYTDSTTLVTGMTLYDNTGTDTGLTIGTVNQDGSFEVSSNWQLTVIQQADSIDGTLEIYSDSEKTNVIGSITFPTRRPSSPVSQSIVVSGYNTIWVESVGEGGEYGMENVSITGGTFIPDTELYHMYLGGSITRESDSVVFSYYED